MNASHSASLSAGEAGARAPVAARPPSKRAREVLAGERLDTLDGMRGVAALMVVVYHFFARWAAPVHTPTLYPHGNMLAEAPFLIIFGDVGILLFFLVSGFVIMMTLERSTGILDFTGRRIARLWPAMIVCATMSTILVVATDIDEYYPGKEWWAVLPFEYVSSIFFLPPDKLGPLLGMDGVRLDWVEGVYWTLWHEVRFYALVSIVFLIASSARFLWAWAIVQGVSTIVALGMMVIDRNYLVGMGVEVVFQPQMLGWFSLGLCGYLVWSGRSERAIAVIAVLAAIAILARDVVHMPGDALALNPKAGQELLTYAVVIIPFVLFLARSPVLNVLRSRVIVTIGLASYPLYLFHELPGMAGMKIGAELGAPPLLTAFLTMGLVILVAIAIHYLVEMPGKRVLTALWKRMVSGLEERATWLRY